MAELADALDLESSVQKTYRFKSGFGHNKNVDLFFGQRFFYVKNQKYKSNVFLT